MIKVIFADIDGTLRDNVLDIDDNLVKVISDLKNIGIKVIITTGRNYLHAKKYALSIGAYPIIIACNGALVKRYDTDKVIYKSDIKLPIVRKLYKYVKDYDCQITSMGEKENIILRSTDDLKIGIVSLNITSKDYNFMNNLIKTIKEYYPILSTPNYSSALHLKEEKKNKEYFCDITNNLVDKGSAVKKVCEYLNIPLNEVMTIGDNYNDISMVLQDSYNVCPKNACNELKNKVQYVMQEDIITFLERILESGGVYEEKTNSRFNY